MQCFLFINHNVASIQSVAIEEAQCANVGKWREGFDIDLAAIENEGVKNRGIKSSEERIELRRGQADTFQRGE